MKENDSVLLVVGISWRTSPIAVREQVAFSDAVIPEALNTLRRFSGCREAMVLSTCNRVEIYATSEDGPVTAKYLKDFLAAFHDRDDPRFDQYCYAYIEEKAVTHLFRVAAGLDSMVVGENEILHQLKEAAKRAAEENALGGKLAFLVDQAAKMGREVRKKTKINSGAVSIATAACELAHNIFGRLENQRVLILGTGKMSTQTLRNFVRDGVGQIVICARDKQKALELAATCGAEAVDFSEWMRHLAEADIVVVSTGAPHYLIHSQDIKHMMTSRKHRPLFVIDIAVPRNADPAIGQVGDVYLYNIDDLKEICDGNVKLRKKEVQACENLIEPRVRQFFTQLEKMKAGPTIEALNRRFDDIAREEIKRISQAARYSPEETAELERLVTGIKGKFLHHPMTKLKEAAEDGGVYRYTETIQRLFELHGDESETKK